MANNNKFEEAIVMINGFQSVKIMYKYSKLPAIMSVLLMCLSSCFTGVQILITKNLIDSVQIFILGNSRFLYVVIWVVFTFLAVLFNSSNEYFHTLINISINRNLNKNFIPMIMEKLKKIEYACFEKPETHNLISRMSQSPQSAVVNCFNSLTALMTYVFSLIGVIIYFFTVSIPFTLIYIVITILYCYLTSLRTKKMYKMWDNRAEEGRKMEYLNSLLVQKHPLSELRVLGGTHYLVKKWGVYLKAILSDFTKHSIKGYILQFANNIVLCLWAGFMIFFAANMAINGTETAGFFIAILTGIGNIASITKNLSYAYNDYVSANISYRYFNDFISLPESCNNLGGEEASNTEIKFENVFFKYPDTNEQILKGVSFTIKQNERISIVGKNGAGKSTIIKLLCGLYKPDSGKIYIGDVELGKISKKSMREIMSVVFQDFGQYSLTLRENIALGRIESINDDKRLVDALRLAISEGLLEKQNFDLDSPLGKLEEKGTDLSGGQWQRISIARAFFTNSKLIVLDEPTASLDPMAECKMYETFLNVLKNKGSITISHRLASAKMADRILVISDGKITEQGTHTELMAVNGEYFKMFTSQASWYNESLEGGVLNA